MDVRAGTDMSNDLALAVGSFMKVINKLIIGASKGTSCFIHANS